MNRLLRRMNSLRNRMLLIFLVLLAIITTVTLTVVNQATYTHSTGQLHNHAKTSASVVEDKLLNRARALHDALTVMSSNFNLKKLMFTAQNDPESLRAAMSNFQQRNDADVYWVTDSDGQVVQSSFAGNISLPHPSQMPAQKLDWLHAESQIYMVQSVPVKKTPSSRNVDFWIVMGIAANHLIGDELLKLTDMQVSLVSPGSPNAIYASTFELEQQVAMSKIELIADAQLHETWIDNTAHIYAAFPIGDWQQSTVFALLCTSKDSAYLSYTSLLLQLAILLGIAAILSFFAAVIFSNSIVKPIAKLAGNALRISGGDYDIQVKANSTNEVNTLASAFQQMTCGIKEREAQIHKLAYFDELTELPNRIQFRQQIQTHIEQQPEQTLLVLMLDIDRFKEINDTVGHQTGDRLLKLITERMRSFSSLNAFYARIGGDEFGIIFDKLNGQSADHLAQCIAQLFEQPYYIDGLTLDVDASIGVASYPQDGDNADVLMQCADIALYSCKGQHKAYALYQPELNKHSVQRLNLMSELKEALGRGELMLHYQPKLTLPAQTVDTAECLIRWIHPVHGFIPPDEFIPLAEQTGAIRHVTHWALEQAIQQHQDWRSKGFVIGMAVNISAVDLVDLTLPTYVSELLDNANVSPNMLTLEVTESAIMGDPENAMKALNILRRMGITLSIDDFGTGYSSMAQLKKMPVDELKIDKAFVLELANNADDQVMVKTLLSLAENLGLRTVAEGVEDAASLAFLSQHSCSKAQGFHMSRPLKAQDFEAWLTEYQQENIKQA